MSELLNALRRNLANREEIGDEETAKLLRKRIAKEENASEPEPEPESGPAFATDDDKPVAKPAASKKGTA